MAIVPGDPNEGGNVAQQDPMTRGVTMAHFLQAAAIMEQKGRFQVAGDVVPYSQFRSAYQERTYQAIQKDPGFLDKRATKGILGTVLESGEGNVLQMTPKDK